MLTKSCSRSLFIFTLSLIFRLYLFIQAYHQDRTFITVSKHLTQSDAKSYCREHYTDLAAFRSTSEITALESPCRLSDFCWIGIQRVKHGPLDWNWSDGETNNFRKWKQGEPNNENGNENCVATSWDVWYDTSCDGSYDFLCYEDDPILIQESKMWEEALEYCRALNVDPYTNNNYFKNAFDLMQMRTENSNSSARGVMLDAQTQEAWIGLRSLAGEWLWLNGDPLQLQLPVCPEAGKHCVSMTLTGDINLRNCSDNLYFLCSRN